MCLVADVCIVVVIGVISAAFFFFCSSSTFFCCSLVCFFFDLGDLETMGTVRLFPSIASFS
ncbi:hypothetical protein IMZ48_23235 [Candidatus Bathyarchaeota archaeon]|nr:hypothetical protein [Candidatus Bathyarchaeota archaeon]